jgi:hypothetical protein
MSRLQLPVVETESKLDITDSNRTPLQLFMDTQVHKAPGYKIRTSVLYDAYKAWCKENNQPEQHIVSFVKENRFETWRSAENVSYIPNIALVDVPPSQFGPIIIHDKKPHYRDASGNLQRLQDNQIPGGEI